MIYVRLIKNNWVRGLFGKEETLLLPCPNNSAAVEIGTTAQASGWRAYIWYYETDTKEVKKSKRV